MHSSPPKPKPANDGMMRPVVNDLPMNEVPPLEEGSPDLSVPRFVPSPLGTDAGSLVVFVTTAGGAIPIEDALVTVYTDYPDGSSELLYVTRTNRSGRTAQLPLPAPPRSNSLSPGSRDPYAEYSVTVHHPGFQSETKPRVQIFADVVASQRFSLKPEALQSTARFTQE